MYSSWETGTAELSGSGGQLTPTFSVHAAFDPHFLSTIPTLTPTFHYPPRPLMGNFFYKWEY